MAKVYDGLKSETKFKYQTSFSPRYDKQGETGQMLG